MSKHRAEIIAERQHQIRLWLHQEMEFLPLTGKLDDVGKYAAYRFFRFAQLALFKNGTLLNNDTQWATVEKEITDWPMRLWLSILDNDEIIKEAKEVYNVMGNGRFTITQHTEEGSDRPFKLVKLGWVNRNMRSATELDIFKWLGHIGGELPARPPSDDQEDE